MPVVKGVLIRLFRRDVCGLDVSRIEGRIPADFGRDARAIEGAHELLRRCDAMGVPWAVVTSGTRALVEGWSKALGLPRPGCSVVAEEVEHGKPDPAGYRLARSQLGLAADARTLVLEDSPAGIQAGKAAGCDVVALTTTHAAEAVARSGADWIVSDLRDVVLRGRDAGTGRWRVQIRA